MTYGMYISAAGAHTQSERLQILTNNLANVDTPGFKRELAVIAARHAEAIEQGRVAAGSGGIDDVGGGVRVAETVFDFTPGSLRPTGNPSDMAIDGEGFFLVQRADQQLLTRAGNFHFSNLGELLTEQGHAVLTSAGEPVVIDPQAPWQLLPSGAIQQGGGQQQLALVKPRFAGDLAKAGQNLFLPLATVEPVADGERRVLGSHLEQSTVRPALEMMELIETSRAYEANIRMIQNQDHMIQNLVNRVLRQ